MSKSIFSINPALIVWCKIGRNVKSLQTLETLRTAGDINPPVKLGINIIAKTTLLTIDTRHKSKARHKMNS